VRVFLDTNVWLSAIVFSGLCSELLASLYESEHDLLTSPLIRAETHDVLERKFARHQRASENFDLLWGQAECIEDVSEPADDADARLVKAASNAGATLFVTGDQRVLGWEALGEVRIVSPRDAWRRLFMAG